jgi:hypothetical protein
MDKIAIRLFTALIAHSLIDRLKTAHKGNSVLKLIMYNEPIAILIAN